MSAGTRNTTAAELIQVRERASIYTIFLYWKLTLRTGKLLLLTLACAAAVYLLYFFRLDAMGLVSTDEPRYAAIGREMARSGDWITPRLWGEAWFEKPALLYWMTAAGTLAGLGPELAPRLPVALLSVAFLVLFYFTLKREWGWQAAFYCTAILMTLAGWLAFSQTAVPDLPLAAFFNAALLLLLPWFRSGDRRLLPYAGACLGLAVLAKGLVPLVLILPVFWFARGRLMHLLHPVVLFAFAAAALPWYVLCTIRNGLPFLQTFFLEHQLGRFTSPDLQHVQPFWFYLPVLLGSFFPWTFLLALLFRPTLYREPHAKLLAAIAGWGLLFFSVSTNKLPGYVVPLLPSLAALTGLSLHRVRISGPWLVLPTVSLAWVPVVSAVLPVALSAGLHKAWPVDQTVKFKAAILMLPLLFIAAVELLADRFRHRSWAVAGIATMAMFSVVWLKISTLPAVDRVSSARALYFTHREVSPLCAAPMSRAWHYGLNYYFERVIPDCKSGQSLDPVHALVVPSH